jgi:hypothetical protein
MASIVAIAVLMVTSALAAEAPILLGTTEPFAVLAGETITNTGPTTITGNVGLDPGTATPGFASVTLVGASTLEVDNAVALDAKNALVTAYNDAAGRGPATQIATELGGQVLTGGVYDSAAGTFEITGTLTLDAQDDPDTVWVFQMESSLVTASASSVSLINGAQACNVFWQVGSSATLGTTTTFVGTIMALTSIFLETGATIQGRALARNGEVTMDTNTITRAACLPAGPVDTGGGSTSGFENAPLVILGAALLAAAVGVLTLRRRIPRRGEASN